MARPIPCWAPVTSATLPRSLIVPSLIVSRASAGGGPTPRRPAARLAAPDFVDSRRIFYGRAQNSSRRETMAKGIGAWLYIRPVILGRRAGGRCPHSAQLLPHGTELPEQERSLPDDLPRGRRRDRRPYSHRCRVPHRRDDDRAARRGGLARRRAGGRLVQVLHVLQGPESHLGLHARQRLYDGRHLRPRPPLPPHAAGRRRRGEVRRSWSRLAEPAL